MVAVIMVSLFPAVSLAQNARGKFTLAVHVHWGNVVLPAGDYRYSLEKGFNVTVWNSAGAPSFLMLPNWFVESLVLPEAEIAVHFRVPAPLGRVRCGTRASGR